MERSVELEVDAAGQVTWHEGRLELAPEVAALIATLPQGTLVDLRGEYFRPTATTKILKVKQPPSMITRPTTRALHAWHRRGDLGPLREHVERDTSATGFALRAGIAARDGRLDEARACIPEALRLGVPRDAGPPLAAAWFAAQPVPLTRDQEDALLALVWQDTHTWHDWIDPVARAAHGRVVTRDRVVPWHFGGPRVTPDRALVTAWLLARAEAIAEPVEGTGIPELQAMTAAQRRAWLRDSERRDERAERDAYAAVLRSHPRDSIDSPPDSADAGVLEHDQPLLAWLRFHAAEHHGDPLVDLAASLVGACHTCIAPPVARALAFALDAVVLLSALAPDLAREVTQVVYLRAALRDGLAIVRTRAGHVMLRAPGGAFGAWEIERGDAAILAAVPGAAEALAGRDPQRCEVVLDPVVRKLVTPAREVRRAPPPPPPPPVERYVVHPKFGRGRVVESRREGSETKLLIEFPGVGQKLLLERFVTAAD